MFYLIYKKIYSGRFITKLKLNSKNDSKGKKTNYNSFFFQIKIKRHSDKHFLEEVQRQILNAIVSVT